MKSKILLTFFSFFSLCGVIGQVNVTGGLTAQQLAEIFAGSNISVSNAVITGPSVGYGSFLSSGGFPFGSGVVLTNGMLTQVPGPNNDPNTSSNLGGAGTTEMDDLGGSNSSDVITLEFDFIVQSSSVQFQYIFASEEYPEFAPPNQPSFNDVFAFYISGPGIVGQENIALIPGTSNPVSIDNVNPVTFPQYYVDNTDGQQIQFDGYTTDLTATRAGLTACETYHLRMVIADIQTANRNSAVFLKENSFVQENVLGAETQTINADGIALEGCVRGSFDFEYTEVSTQDRTITFTIGGTAVNGVDYSYIDNYITIPAGETAGTVFVDAFSDGLAEGAETVTLTFETGVCVGTETVQLTINDAQPINFTLDGTDLDCFEDNSGEILVNATGGFPGYTYLVTDPFGTTTTYTTNPITNLAAGQYSVQVNDTYGCKAEALVIGGQFNAGTTFLPDGNGVTYEAPLDISGFNPGQTITNINQVQQICLTMEHSYLGDLWIRVQSPSGQVVTLKQQNGGGACDLGEPIATGPVDGNSGDPTPGEGYEYCFNANPTYSTMVNESGNFTRNYIDGVGNSYFDNYLPAGSYTSSGNFSNLVGSQMNGTWKVMVTDQFGQDNGYIFNWYISLIGDLPDTIVALSQPQTMTIAGIANNATCGSSNGSININVLNGEAPLTYLWSNGAVTEDLNNVSAGEYTVTVTDANGCSISESFFVNNIGTLSLTSQVNNVNCFGGNDGAITVIPAGGTAPYTYLWSTSEITNSINDLTAGNYTVTITDQIGCIYNQTITVNQNSQLIANLTASSNEICNTTNGSIDITPSGGNGSYAFSWSNGATTEDLVNLNSGSYTVTITDGLGCSGTNSFTIVNNLTGCSNFCYTEINPNAIVNSTCGAANGSINIDLLNAVAPYTILWSNGASSEDITSLTPGIYTVTVTDANNCSQTESFEVANSTNGFTISTVSITDETCGYNNGAIDISITGGSGNLDYTWSNGSITEDVTTLSEGTYTVNITDELGCTLTQSYLVENNSGMLNVEGFASSAACNASTGAITQTVNSSNGIVTYLWSNGATTKDISGLLPGVYSCTYTDASGCSGTNSYTVGQNNGGIALTGTLITNEVCNNNLGAINLTLTGNGLSYLWNTGATTEDISGLTSGNYSCTITNGQGCSLSTGTITVINTAGTMVVSNQSIINEVCNNNSGSIDINVYNGQSPYTYSWSNGAIIEDISGLSEGIYTLQLMDNNGCTLAHSVTITNESGTLDISNAILTHEGCVGGIGTNNAGAIDITTTGGSLPYTYTWSNGAATEDISNISDGIYTVTVLAANGCTHTESFEILANGSNIAISGSSIAPENCGSGTGAIDITMAAGSGPYNYSWSNGAITEDISGLSAGVYTLTVNNMNGCQISQAFTITNDLGNLMVTANILNETCGESNAGIDLLVSGGNGTITYEWSNGAITQDISGISAGTYSSEISDQFGCVFNYTGIVTNDAQDLSAAIGSITDELCGQNNGGIDVDISGTGTLNYLWSNGATTEDIAGVAAGNYSLTVTNDSGCSTTITGTVTNQTNGLAINFSNVQNEVCNNNQGFIDIEVTSSQPITYLWSNSAITQDISGLSDGNYSVIITDDLGCELTQSYTIGNTNNSNVNATANVVDAFCSASNGSINVTVTNGISPFTYSWNTGQFSEDLFNVTAGSYTLTILDGANCETNQTFVVGQQNSGLGFTNLQIQDEFCGQEDGQIIIFTGGTADDYYIDGVNNGGPNFFNLAAGTYTMAISDDFGCYVEQEAIVGEQSTFNVAQNIINATCNESNGSIFVQTFGGSGNYTFEWSNGATTESIQNVPAGIYTLTITDNGGFPCTTDYTFEVTDNSDFEISAIITSAYCGDNTGAISQTIEAGSDLTFEWSTGETTQTISGLTEGEYTCTVASLTGCTIEYTYIVPNTTSGIAVNATVSNQTCGENGAVEITISGGSGNYSFDWSNASPTEDLTGLVAGDYTLTIIDLDDNCSLTQTYTIENEVQFFNATGTVNHATCATCLDGSILVSINNANNFTYLWSPGGQQTKNIFNLNPGEYSLVITNANGCDTTLTFNVGNTVGIETLSIENTFMNVYPNPASSEFNVEYNVLGNQKGQLMLIDVFGKTIRSEEVSGSGSVRVNVLDLENGIYFMKLSANNDSLIEKIILAK